MSSFYTPPNVRGLDTQIQYNENGVLSASSDLTWDDATKELGVGGDINLDDGGTYATTLQLITPTANRTISFPDATGTVALVAGSSGQLLYNNAGANGGVPSSAIGASGDITLSLAGAASTPPVSLTGTWFSGGTATTTKPQFLIEPTGTTSTAWSTNGTGLGVNAASGFTGRLFDFQVNGSSKAVLTGAGLLGLGTSAVDEKLHIEGAGTQALKLVNTTGGSYASPQLLQIKFEGPSSREKVRLETTDFSANSVGGELRIYTRNTSDVLTQAVVVDQSQRVGVNTTSPTALLDVSSDVLRLRTAKTPASATDTGNAGDICWDANYVYVCTATNTWKRSALSSW